MMMWLMTTTQMTAAMLLTWQLQHNNMIVCCLMCCAPMFTFCIIPTSHCTNPHKRLVSFSGGWPSWPWPPQPPAGLPLLCHYTNWLWSLTVAPPLCALAARWTGASRSISQLVDLRYAEAWWRPLKADSVLLTLLDWVPLGWKSERTRLDGSISSLGSL